VDNFFFNLDSGFPNFFLRPSFLMLTFYFIAKVSRGCHRCLDFGFVRLPLHNHLSEQHGGAEINQVILFHIFLTWSDTVTCEEHSNVMSSWSRMLGGDRDELLHFGCTSGASPPV
jgi:hypothetical protein